MQKQTICSNALIKVAAVVIIIAGLISAKTIVIPILLAVFITILTSPLLVWLQDKGLRSGFALMGVVSIVIIIMSLLGLLMSASLHDFSSNLPVYEEKLRTIIGNVISVLHDQGVEFSDKSIAERINPSAVTQFASDIVKGFGSALTNGFMILLLVIFMLLEASVIPKKLEALHGDASSHMAEFLHNVKQYMKIKSIFSLITGILIYIGLALIGLDYALLWAILAFLLNFVPNIGSIIAAIPAVILALIQIGFVGSLEVAVLFIVINILVGSVFEPKYMGEGLGISTLVVFISLIFWGWVFGPVGMLLSIPLTIMLKLALQTNPETRWIAVFLGSEVK